MGLPKVLRILVNLEVGRLRLEKGAKRERRETGSKGFLTTCRVLLFC